MEPCAVPECTNEASYGYNYCRAHLEEFKAAAEKKVHTPEELDSAQTDVNKAYVDATLTILHLKGHGEVNFVKTSFTTPQGGTYMLQLVHVEGPKIDCQKDIPV